MSRYEQLSMFTMNVEQVTATCCMDGCPARASPVEPWMAALIPAGEYVVQVAGHPLVLRPMPGRQADIQRGHEYYHYMIGGRHIRWEGFWMMDKIVVTAADIEKLLAWRDEHNDLVRSMPVPLREVEIQIVESGISIKCFRSDKKLKLYLDSPARKLGHVVFAPLGNGLWKKKVSTLPADCNPAETEQGALTVYGSLMALMTYGTGSIRGAATTTLKAPAGRKSPTKPHTASTTYIIHSAGKQLTVVPRGHHASPACSFTVRGHFRHYKSGKTVWIAEYSKGTGHSRGKTYKIGGDLDDREVRMAVPR